MVVKSHHSIFVKSCGSRGFSISCNCAGQLQPIRGQRQYLMSDFPCIAIGLYLELYLFTFSVWGFHRKSDHGAVQKEARVASTGLVNPHFEWSPCVSVCSVCSKRFKQSNNNEEFAPCCCASGTQTDAFSRQHTHGSVFTPAALLRWGEAKGGKGKCCLLR